MKKEGMAETIVNLVSFDPVPEALTQEASEAQITVYVWEDLLHQMESVKDAILEDTTCEDTYIFSYTSGTTGDSKGVKLTHKNIMSSVDYVIPKFPSDGDQTVISYLPLPHSFEQCMMGYALLVGAKIGYYQGNPLKLIEDCGFLQPTIFPSVPRLYNRIYSVIKQRLDSAVGCKGMIVRKA